MSRGLGDVYKTPHHAIGVRFPDVAVTPLQYVD
jgi:hypothetical protein